MARVDTYKSYAAQAGHYFDRPHTVPPVAPLEGPAVWRGSEIAGRDDWRAVLAPAQAEELRQALAAARATGKPTQALRAEDFPLATLGAEIARWRDAIVEGRGFQVVSGVPVADWSQEEAEVAFWCIGQHMGTPGAQNPQGDLLGQVVDTGDDVEDPYVRLYRTASNIAYHCDAADGVGLLCLRAAKKGGASRIVSSVSVYNEVLCRRPELVERLYQPFALDVRNEDESGVLQHLPIPPCRFADGRLRTFYHSDYFRSAQRHADVAPFTPAEQELLDLYEEIAASPELYLDMDLAPGDIQWLSNHTILHARTAYEDHEDPARRRLLLRLWLSLE
jgi:hypothetical protein